MFRAFLPFRLVASFQKLFHDLLTKCPILYDINKIFETFYNKIKVYLRNIYKNFEPPIDVLRKNLDKKLS